MPNADLKIAQTRQLQLGSTGLKDITIGGFGTPKAAIFLYGEPVIDDVMITNVSKMAIGYTDGVNEVFVAVAANGNVTTTQTSRSNGTTRVTGEPIGTGGTVSSASFHSWITDGVRINVTTANNNQLLTIVLIGGSDVQAYAGYKLLSSTNNTISNVGFEPNVGFISSTGLNIANGGTSLANLMQGFFVNNGSELKNMSLMTYNQHGAATTKTSTYVSDEFCTGQFLDSFNSWLGKITATNSDGCTLQTNKSTGSDHIYFLLLRLENAPLIDLFVEDSPTAIGMKSFGSTLSKPDFVFGLYSDTQIVNTLSQSGLSVSFFTACENSTYSNGFSSEHGVSSQSNESSISVLNKLVVPKNGSKMFEADTITFTSSGFSANFLTVNSTPRKWINLYIGSSSASAAAYDFSGTAYISVNATLAAFGNKDGSCLSHIDSQTQFDTTSVLISSSTTDTAYSATIETASLKELDSENNLVIKQSTYAQGFVGATNAAGINALLTLNVSGIAAELLNYSGAAHVVLEITSNALGHQIYAAEKTIQQSFNAQSQAVKTDLGVGSVNSEINTNASGNKSASIHQSIEQQLKISALGCQFATSNASNISTTFSIDTVGGTQPPPVVFYRASINGQIVTTTISGDIKLASSIPGVLQ